MKKAPTNAPKSKTKTAAPRATKANAAAKGATKANAATKKSAPKKSASKKTSAPREMAPRLIDARIKELGDWRGTMLEKLRALIHQADPEVIEEWKWGVPVFSHDGILCTGETYKSAVKLTFPKGAALDDPKGLFNSSLEGNTRRAIDFKEGEKIDEKGLKALFRAAVTLNASG